MKIENFIRRYAGILLTIFCICILLIGLNIVDGLSELSDIDYELSNIERELDNIGSQLSDIDLELKHGNRR